MSRCDRHGQHHMLMDRKRIPLPAAPVEAELFLRQTDGLNHIIEMNVFEGCYIQILPDSLDHPPVPFGSMIQIIVDTSHFFAFEGAAALLLHFPTPSAQIQEGLLDPFHPFFDLLH